MVFPGLALSQPKGPKLKTIYGIAPLKKPVLTIDGNLEDWPPLRPIPLYFPFQVSGAKSYKGKGDLAAKAFMCWDEKFLYLAVAVLDDSHLTLKTSEFVGLNPSGVVGDGVFVRFDPLRDTRILGNVPQREDDKEFWFGGKGGKGVFVVSIDRIHGKIREEKRIEAAFKRTRKKGKEGPWRLWYEAAIPWKCILPEGMKPRPGTWLGMDMVVEDFDFPHDPLPQTRIGWTFGSGPILYPGYEGSVVLLEKPLKKGETLEKAPPRPEVDSKTYKGAEDIGFWQDLSLALDKAPPSLGKPSGKRLEILGNMDASISRWPVLDLGMLVARYQRGMFREAAGIMSRGAPSLLRYRSKKVFEALNEDPPREGNVVVVRLPWSGWLIRSHFLNIVIDPFLPGLHRHVVKTDVLLLSNALDFVRRDDPLIFAMVELKRPILAHMPIILPYCDTSKIPRLRPGEGINLGEAEIAVIGPGKKKSRLPPQIGFLVRFKPLGPIVIIGGYYFQANWIKESGGEWEPPDLLILPISHPELEKQVREINPRAFIPSDALDLPLDLTGKSDVRLKKALETLDNLEGTKWMLLFWGEKAVVKGGKGF